MIEKEYKIAFEDGIFRELILKFIQYKRGIGFKYGRAVEGLLSRLNNSLNEYALETLHFPKEIVEKLAERRSLESPATQAKRIGLLRHLAIFLNTMGYEAYVYPKLYNVKLYSSFSPYIFSQEQISAIINASDSLKYSANSPKYHIVWPTFIRVLYGCGLRLSEALRLKITDIDLENGVLFIEKSKKNTSRYVPMSKSLTEYCMIYAEQMKLNLDGEGYFFPAPDNGKYAPNTARDTIKGLYATAGIPRLGNGRLPRVHDVRHSFCCHTLELMQQKGFDLYYSLPILSTYLGHQGIRDTERYLQLPSFQFPKIIEIEHAAWDGIIPEVTYIESE